MQIKQKTAKKNDGQTDIQANRSHIQIRRYKSDVMASDLASLPWQGRKIPNS